MNKTERLITDMKHRVYEGNMGLPEVGLVKLTWGNVSEINRNLGVIVIKPSGVPYEEMAPNQMVVTDLRGEVLGEGSLKPSSDLPTHVILYQNFPEIKSVVHTHSTHAVSWAQAGYEIPALGTTHADTFFNEVPCTRQLSESEVAEEYEKHTGDVIVETFKDKQLKPLEVPGVLVKNHGPFTWGLSVEKAVENSLILEEVALMAKETRLLNPQSQVMPDYLLLKHYQRKHGDKAYYGQVSE